MRNHNSAFLQLVSGLTCLWCNELFKRPVTLGCGHSLCWFCAARVREREEEPRCRYEECGMEIRDITYVVNRTLDKVAELANNLKPMYMDEFGADSGEARNSIASSCSSGSMDPPPVMSPARISEFKPPNTARPQRLVVRSVSNTASSHGDSGVEELECTSPSRTSRGHGSLPLSGSNDVQSFKREEEPRCRYEDCGVQIRDMMYVVNRTYDTVAELLKIVKNPPNDELCGHSGIEPNSVTSSVSSLKPPPLMSPVRTSDSELLSTSTGRTRSGHGSLIQSLLPLSGKSKVHSLKRDSSGDLDDEKLEQRFSDLGWKRSPSVTRQYPIHPGTPDIKDFGKASVTKRSWESKDSEEAKKFTAYSKRSSSKRKTIDPEPELYSSESCWSLTYPDCTVTNVKQDFRVPISRTTSMDPLPKQSSYKQIPVRPPPTSLHRRAVSLGQGITYL